MTSFYESDCGAESPRDRQRGTLVEVLWIDALMFAAIAAARGKPLDSVRPPATV